MQGGVRFDAQEQHYALGGYPHTAELLARGGSCVVSAEDPTADPAERALLEGWGMSSVLAAAATDAHGDRWLVELYADGHSSKLTEGARHLRALVREAVSTVEPGGSSENGASSAARRVGGAVL